MVDSVIPAPPQMAAWDEPTAADIQALRLKYGFVTLDDLTTDHIDDMREKRTLRDCIAAASNWIDGYRAGVRGQGFILLSPNYGCGKTHIARAMTFNSVSLSWNGHVENSVMYSSGSWMVSARDLMLRFGEKDEDGNSIKSGRIIPHGIECVLIDDVGREGVLPYIKQTDDKQAHETQIRYFSVIDFCDRANISVIITTNFSVDELMSYVGGATASRLEKMVPNGNRFDLGDVRDYRPYIGGYR